MYTQKNINPNTYLYVLAIIVAALGFASLMVKSTSALLASVLMGYCSSMGILLGCVVICKIAETKIENSAYCQSWQINR